MGAARAVKALCEIGGKGSLGSQHAPGIARQLLQVCLLIAGFLSLWHLSTVLEGQCLYGISAALSRCVPLVLSYTEIILQEIPGRLWDGKEVVLEALGCLVAAEPHCVQPAEDVINALLGTLLARQSSSRLMHENTPPQGLHPDA